MSHCSCANRRASTHCHMLSWRDVISRRWCASGGKVRVDAVQASTSHPTAPVEVYRTWESCASDANWSSSRAVRHETGFSVPDDEETMIMQSGVGTPYMHGREQADDRSCACYSQRCGVRKICTQCCHRCFPDSPPASCQYGAREALSVQLGGEGISEQGIAIDRILVLTTLHLQSTCSFRSMSHTVTELSRKVPRCLPVSIAVAIAATVVTRSTI